MDVNDKLGDSLCLRGWDGEELGSGERNRR